MKERRYRFQAKVWLYVGDAAWHFVTVPKEESGDIQNRFGAKARGWRSLPVMVTVGKTTWKTSIFLDNRAGGYLLPLKADVRKKEMIKQGSVITISLEVQP